MALDKKIWNEAKSEVAKTHRLGTTLVTGHRAQYWEEATGIYTMRILQVVAEDIKELREDMKLATSQDPALLEVEKKLKELGF